MMIGQKQKHQRHIWKEIKADLWKVLILHFYGLCVMRPPPQSVRLFSQRFQHRLEPGWFRSGFLQSRFGKARLSNDSAQKRLPTGFQAEASDWDVCLQHSSRKAKTR